MYNLQKTQFRRWSHTVSGLQNLTLNVSGAANKFIFIASYPKFIWYDPQRSIFQPGYCSNCPHVSSQTITNAKAFSLI